MTWTQVTMAQLQQARQELAAAEEGLAAGTPASRARYARALHEADLAERQAIHAERDPNWRGDGWRLAQQAG
jgi:hypothetical protein